MRVLLDTNIVIYHLKGDVILPQIGVSFVISVITQAELLRHPQAMDNDLALIEAWFTTVDIIPIDSSIARRAAEIGRNHRSYKLPDLLIAATALELGIPLVTKNTKDFMNILRLIVKESV